MVMNVIQFLVGEGANVNVCDGKPLLTCCHNNYFDILEYLINNGDVLLDIALEEKYLHMVKYLIDHGANIHVCYDTSIFG